MPHDVAVRVVLTHSTCSTDSQVRGPAPAAMGAAPDSGVAASRAATITTSGGLAIIGRVLPEAMQIALQLAAFPK